VRGPEQTTITDGLLLRAIDYAEADRIIVLFTRELGKISVIARGARKSRRRFQGSLEPFSLLKAEVLLGGGELGSLVQTRIGRTFPRIIENLLAMRQAGAAMELVRSVTPIRQSDPELFEATLGLLELIDKNPEQAEQSLICFQVQVMKLAGFAPCFDACGKCHNRARDTQPGNFDPAAGFLICRTCGQAPVYLSAATRQGLLASLALDWQHLNGIRWTSEQLQQARTAMSLFIGHRLQR
jgi:DNA repair protein RecO (recombination protein O)